MILIAHKLINIVKSMEDYLPLRQGGDDFYWLFQELMSAELTSSSAPPRNVGFIEGGGVVFSRNRLVRGSHAPGA